MRFKKVTFNPLSIMVGVHYGRNPATGDRFLHMAFCPFIGFDFWWPEDEAKRLAANPLNGLPPGEYTVVPKQRLHPLMTFGVRRVLEAFPDRIINIKLDPDSPWVWVDVDPAWGKEVNAANWERKFVVWKATDQLYDVNPDGSVGEDPLPADTDLTKIRVPEGGFPRRLFRSEGECPLGTPGCKYADCSPAPGHSCFGPDAPAHVDMLGGPRDTLEH
jgi:hypothetical protein